MPPGETEAGSAGKQPCRGIAWSAHPDNDRQREIHPLALLLHLLGWIDPPALQIPARRAEHSFTPNGLAPIPAEPRQRDLRFFSINEATSELISSPGPLEREPARQGFSRRKCSAFAWRPPRLP